MAQLKMCRFKGTPIEKASLPEGYSVSNYRTPSDRMAWVECCKNGLVGDDATEQAFADAIESREDINLEEDVFFLDYNGEHIGTVTAYVDTEDCAGDVHMVGIRSDFRGRGLAKFLNIIAAEHLDTKDIPYSFLTTDEWRKGAVKSYLNAGFLPVEYDEGMEERWAAVLKEYNIAEVKMVREDGSFYKTVKAAE